MRTLKNTTLATKAKNTLVQRRWTEYWGQNVTGKCQPYMIGHAIDKAYNWNGVGDMENIGKGSQYMTGSVWNCDYTMESMQTGSDAECIMLKTKSPQASAAA